MDLENEINKVSDLNDYIELSKNLESKLIDGNIVLKMSCILSLKRLRYFEIEYFNKCGSGGAAFMIFEWMLRHPSSPSWDLRELGSESARLIKFWLDAVINHLISHHIDWWSFLRRILSFIKELRTKDRTLSSTLVEELAEAMLDLATSSKPSIHQTYEILHTFNLLCADSARQIRQKMRTQLDVYFIRLSTVIATCGHLPIQFASLETLMRWLLNRQEPANREQAAAKWFMPHLYPPAVVDIFRTRSWMNFAKDARDLLNCQNEAKDLVTSVICKRLTVENVVIISDEERHQSWLDINMASRSMSLLLEPRQLQPLGLTELSSCEVLLIGRDTVRLVRLHREAAEVRISVQMVECPPIEPSHTCVSEASECEVTAVISGRSHLQRVHAALTAVFDDKYQLMLDVNDMSVLSPLQDVNGRPTHTVGTSCSHSEAAVRRRTSLKGIVEGSRRIVSSRSPSTTSTRSLALLHDKLANLPYSEIPKGSKVAARPSLSTVNETSEFEISNSLGSDNSTLKLEQVTVEDSRAFVEEKKSRSDGEIIDCRGDLNDIHSKGTDHNPRGSQSEKYVKQIAKNNEREEYSFLQNNEREAHSLSLAPYNSLIDAGIEHQKDQEINYDLKNVLVQEALQAKRYEINEPLDSGINTQDEKKSMEKTETGKESETIEDTQYTGIANRRVGTLRARKNVETLKKKIVSKSTSDESNTEAINETPVSFVNVRRRNQRKKCVRKSEADKPDPSATFDEKVVEEFFSQHITENKIGNVLISPTLAKKINETSSESDDELLIRNISNDFDIRNEEIPDLDIVECLNDIVDKVSIDFEKYTKYFDKQDSVSKILQNITIHEDTSRKETKDEVKKKSSKGSKQNPKQPIKLKFSSKKQKPKPKNKSKLLVEPVSKMSTIIEDDKESSANKTSSSDTRQLTSDSDKKTPSVRRKRKLYSLTDDQLRFDSTEATTCPRDVPIRQDSDDEHLILANIKKREQVTSKSKCPYNENIEMDTKKERLESSASCYRQIEKERQKFKRTRSRRSKSIKSPPSPKTNKMNEIFEKLKDNIETHDDHIILADKDVDKDVAIFNFTSDSEDEDFKQKKIEIQKRTSTTTIGSGTSILSIRRGRPRRKVNYTEDSKKTSDEVAAKPKRKRAPRRKDSKNKTPKVIVDRPLDLENERMREAAPEELNTSVVVQTATKPISIKQPEPNIQAPELELAEDENANLDIEDIKQKSSQIEKKPSQETKKETTKNVKTSVRKQVSKQAVKESKNAIKTKKKLDETVQDTKEKSNEKDDDRTLSPLPELLIEKEITKADNGDSLSTNLLNMCKKVCKDGPDANDDTTTTQNMLLGNEKANGSPEMNLTSELKKIFGENSSNGSNKKNNLQSTDSEEKANSDVDVIDNTIYLEQMSEINKSERTKYKKRKLALKSKNKTDSSVKSNSTKGDIQLKPKAYTQQIVIDSQKPKVMSVKSQIEEINLDKTIVINTELVTRSAEALGSSKRRSSSKEVEIVNIASSENEPEGSVASDGITGHGDANEPPPNLDLLIEKFSPREIQDMDSTTREYYIELSKKINNSGDSIEPSLSPRANQAEKDKHFQKHVYNLERLCTESECSSRTSGMRTLNVSITKMSRKEISKYLSPAKNIRDNSEFESADNTQDQSKCTLKLALDTQSTKDFQETSHERSENRLQISKQSQENKRIRSRKSQISPVNLEEFLPERKVLSNDASNNETSMSKSSEIARKLESKHERYFMRSTHASSPIAEREKSENPAFKIAPKRKSPETGLSKAFSMRTVDVSITRLSSKEISKYLSPAKNKPEFYSESANTTQDQFASTLKPALDTQPTKDFPVTSIERSGNRLQTKRSEEKKRNINRKSQISPVNLEVFLPKQKMLRNDVSRNKPLMLSPDIAEEFEGYFMRPTHASSPISEKSTLKLASKRKNSERGGPEVVPTKQRKLNDDFDRQSSNVEDWLKNISSSSKVDTIDASSDMLQNLIEKLDTILPEINRNTTKDFFDLFAEGQKRLVEMRKERQRLFAEMDRIMGDREDAFMSWLKQRACDVLRKDGRQKRALVTLLKEDVQAVVDHLARQQH